MNVGNPMELRGDKTLKLARGVRLRHDATRGQIVLLAPERAIALDDIAVKIVEALDGTRTLDQITDDFAAEFAAPREQIAGDVMAFVRELVERRMVEAVQ